MWLGRLKRAERVSGGAVNVDYGKSLLVLAFNAICIVC